MTYDNTNRGTISKNERKEQQNHPDITGSLDVEGNAYWINGWLKKSSDGRTFYSLSVKRKEARPATDAGFSEPAASDDIPF